MYIGLDLGDIWSGSIDLRGRLGLLGVGESILGKYLSEKR